MFPSSMQCVPCCFQHILALVLVEQYNWKKLGMAEGIEPPMAERVNVEGRA